MTPTTVSAPPPVSPVFDRILWALQILLALLFGFSGMGKLLGAKEMVAIFTTLGQGDWFRYFTGAMEVLSAVALLVPGWARFGAMNLVGVMVGAVVSHVLKLGGSPVAALVLLALSGVVAWGRRYQPMFPFTSRKAPR